MGYNKKAEFWLGADCRPILDLKKCNSIWLAAESKQTNQATCSDFVHFIVKIRRKFLQCFTKYTEDFPTTSGEALFIGTVLHGLDHKMFTNVVEDPIWFEAEDPVFQNCAEIIQIVRAGMVDDLPLIAFNYRYKNAGHPFYREMYKYAATLNKQMADNMDCCIIK